ncbi:hypothetical protein PY68_01745 [Lacticaseibacillus rhamnosus]|nr:hypothetical protein PY68_01745 [Lacticaseibacillus rhamnosus]
MAHYDGPAFLHQNKSPASQSGETTANWQQSENDAYQLPPQITHEATHEVNPQKVAEAQADLRAMTHPRADHQRNGLARLTTPNSTVRNVQRDQTDYRQIAAVLKPDEQSLYLLPDTGSVPVRRPPLTRLRSPWLRQWRHQRRRVQASGWRQVQAAWRQ